MLVLTIIQFLSLNKKNLLSKSQITDHNKTLNEFLKNTTFQNFVGIIKRKIYTRIYCNAGRKQT